MLRAKYQPDPLRAALTSVFWGPRLRDSTKRLVVTSYNLGADGFWLFRTADHSRLRRDWRERGRRGDGDLGRADHLPGVPLAGSPDAGARQVTA